MPRPAGLALAAAVGAAGLVAGVPAPAQAAAATTFTYTGAEQTYPVPDGTTALVITAVGASGHAGNNLEVGGAGAVVTATVPMTALPAGTTTLYVEVGGPGALAVVVSTAAVAREPAVVAGAARRTSAPPPSPRFPIPR